MKIWLQHNATNITELFTNQLMITLFIRLIEAYHRLQTTQCSIHLHRIQSTYIGRLMDCPIWRLPGMCLLLYFLAFQCRFRIKCVSILKRLSPSQVMKFFRQERCNMLECHRLKKCHMQQSTGCHTNSSDVVGQCIVALDVVALHWKSENYQKSHRQHSEKYVVTKNIKFHSTEPTSSTCHFVFLALQ